MKTQNLVLALFLVAIAQFSYAQERSGEHTDTSKIMEAIMRMDSNSVVKELDSVELARARANILILEEMPEFPGGEAAMFKFISKKIKYPKKARKNNIQGRVTVQFVIDEEGNVTEAKVLKGIGYGCDEEALRVVNSMPKWTPGTQKGDEVRVRFVIPIRFVLN